MRVTLGQHYKSAAGKVTGPLTLSSEKALAFPYQCPVTGKRYSEGGLCDTNNQWDDLTSAVYRSDENEYRPSSVTISADEYRRLKDIESFMREVYHRAIQLRCNE
jgi:hypothetical protein